MRWILTKFAQKSDKMGKSNLAETLADLAHRYNSPGFIDSDPVQFPRRYSQKEDIEISAFVTVWISWGNRKQIIRTAEHIDSRIFEHQPYSYLMSCEWRRYCNDTDCFYRTCRNSDFFRLMERLHSVYLQYGDLESAVMAVMQQESCDPAWALSSLFRGINGIADARLSSPCKRLWFFLRWMVRRDGVVDMGIWQRLSPATLIIPLDTHVFQMAREMGITTRHTPDIRTAREITDYFRRIFPDDPALGDFALFGYGVNINKK